jgi:hypothetical protein
MQNEDELMSQVGYIFLGWLFGILSMLIAKWIQTKDEKKKKEIEILAETLKYLFKTKQIYNNLLTDKSTHEKIIKEFPKESSNLERQMYENFDRDIKNNFFPELMFHSFQLKRLDDKSYWKDFENVMNEFEALGKAVFEKSDMDSIFKRNDEINKLMSSFVGKCNSKAKV